ncbi:MAG: DnaJ domain-containing protein [Gammaproteobacteria bacterium]|uniref:DnaJ C-terminal domain-containing protein n=1 Tax=Rhodoferax sp. TaxID=50421 RepID=UPI00183B9833|nr:DnaJ C-terminal domain-containing protein [Rhodoferax sp.]MBU3897354.1 DnaJ domain-containing protein [Gammaproteobacteria bacterium]MBA3058828.1 J domain-containing protein [Rhodoferax sp.]MBU3999233.1 DnaJ domain-containing protein [Gammaproteobacteria bacterium]MBU4018700.1 DnaJ domain-containing protein [Gammaproteobacteria bacterium]MBU4079655.1 DnaJ domain-containing protein [Gammaproteobacteria bacterium]
MEFKDYYKTMGVERGATQDEIKRAHRTLARKYHPDVSKEPNAEARFKEIGEAYEVLKDPEKRAAYDQLGANWKGGQEFRPPPDWNAGFETRGGGFGAGEGGDYSDFFETLFSRGFGAQRGAQRGGAAFHAPGQDRHAKIQIDLEDAYHGATRRVTLQVPLLDAQGHVTTREHTIEFSIPKGVRAGQQIRLAGQGDAGMGQGAPGDLYLEIEFRPHAHYRIDKHDVYLDLPVAPWEAALGAQIDVPTPSGFLDLKIAPGSVEGRKLRLKGRGIPARTPGDFYFVLKIALPAADTEAAQEFYRSMAAQFKSFNPRAKLGVVE